MDLDVALIASLTSDFISHHEYPTQCMLWAARDFKAGMWQDGFNMVSRNHPASMCAVTEADLLSAALLNVVASLLRN